MKVSLDSVRSLRFGDGGPVRSASGVARLRDGLLVVQDDANHAAWWREDRVDRVRLLAPREGWDVFGEDTGTKHLKPDLEAVCPLDHDGGAVLVLGSGSSPARTRCVLVRLRAGRPEVVAGDLAPVYARIATALEVPPDLLNLEGACVAGGDLRWFQRGLPGLGLPSGSVDLRLDDVLAAVHGDLDPEVVDVTGAVRYELGEVAGSGLALTDAVAVRAGVLVSAAAEDTDDPRDDGAVAGSVLALVEAGAVVDAAPVPAVAGRVRKVEGLAVLASRGSGADVLAVVDADDPHEASLALRLALEW